MTTQKRRIVIASTLILAGIVAVWLGRREPVGHGFGDGPRGTPAPGAQRDHKKVLLKADAVAEIEVTSTRVEINEQGLRTTISEVNVVNCKSGDCPQTMVIEQLGGEKDGVELLVEGSTMLKVGDGLVVAAKAKGARWGLVGRDEGVLLDLHRSTPNEKQALERELTAFQQVKQQDRNILVARPDAGDPNAVNESIDAGGEVDAAGAP